MSGESPQRRSFYDRVLHFNSRSAALYRRWVPLPSGPEHYGRRLDRYLVDARTCVHLGAGGKDPGAHATVDLSGKTIYAVDASRESLARNPNPNKIEAWAHDIPLPDESVDLIFSEYLMEHVEDPAATLREAHRLLRPGGHLLWVAPNLWSYAGLATHCTPMWFHRLINRLLEPITARRAAADVFPTFFRVNSTRRVRRLLAETGFKLEELYMVSEAPHYTQVLPVVHQLAILLHIALDRFALLAPFRLVMVVSATRPSGRCRPGG